MHITNAVPTYSLQTHIHPDKPHQQGDNHYAEELHLIYTNNSPT